MRWILVKRTQLQLFYKAVHELNKVEKALIFLFLEGQNHKEISMNLGNFGSKCTCEIEQNERKNTNHHKKIRL